MPASAAARAGAPEAQWSLDLASLDFTFNRPALTLFGTSAENEGGERVSFQRFMEAFSGAGNTQNILQTIVRLARSRQQSAETLHYRLRRLDGEEFDAEFAIQSEDDADGVMVRAFGTLRRLASGPEPGEMALDALAQAFAAPALVAEPDSLQLIAVNDALCTLLHSPAEALIAHTLPELCIDPAEQLQLRLLLADLGLGQEMELHLGLEPEQARPVRLDCRLVAEPRRTYWTVVVTDLTARERVEAELATEREARRAEAALLAATLETAGMATATVLPSGGWVFDAAWRGWLGESESASEAPTDGAGPAPAESWLKTSLSPADAEQLASALSAARTKASERSLSLRLMPPAAPARQLRLRVLRAESPDDTSAGLRVIALDVTAQHLHQLELDESRARRHRLEVALAAPAPDSPEALCAAVGQALECSAVRWVARVGDEVADRASWATSSELLERPSSPAEPWQAVFDATHAWVVKFAALDPRMQPLMEAYLQPLGIQSLMAIPRVGTEPSALLIEQQGPAREWAEEELLAAELLLERYRRHEIDRRAEALAAERDQLAAQHAALAAELGDALALAQRRVTRLERQATLGAWVEGISAQLSEPHAALLAATRALRQSVAASLSGGLSVGEAEPELIAELLRPAPLLAPSAERDLRRTLAERLTDLGIVEADDWARELVELRMTDAPDRLVPLLAQPDARAALQRLAGVGTQLATAEAAAERLELVMSRLSRSASHSSVTDRTEVDWATLVDDCLATLSLAHSHGPRVEKLISLSRPIWADPEQLTQLTLALLAQAYAAAPDATSLSLRVELTERDDYAVLTVADDGPALDSADPAEVFHPAYAGRGKEQSISLGLDWARRAAEDHGGSLEVESDAGATRFRARMPFAPPAPPSTPIAQPADV